MYLSFKCIPYGTDISYPCLWSWKKIHFKKQTNRVELIETEWCTYEPARHQDIIWMPFTDWILRKSSYFTFIQHTMTFIMKIYLKTSYLQSGCQLENSKVQTGYQSISTSLFLRFCMNTYYKPNPICDDHCDDVIMTSMASQITSLTIVYSIVYSGIDQRKHQSSASLAFVRGIHRGPVNSPHKRPVTREMFPFDDVIMHISHWMRVTTHCNR